MQVGYCQGLSFVGGMLLNLLTEEEAFRVLCAVMFRLRLREQYMHDMAALKVQVRPRDMLLWVCVLLSETSV